MNSHLPRTWFRRFDKYSMPSIIWLLLLCVGTAANAQPTENIDLIERQIQQLQQKLQQVKSRQIDGSVDRRVINLGTQSVDVVPKTIAPQTLLQFYDLSDVFGLSPQYTIPEISELDAGISSFSGQTNQLSGGGGFGGGGFGGAFSIPPRLLKPVTQYADTDRSLTMDSIVGIIEKTIDQKQWQSSDASIERIGNGLLINAAPSTHEKIRKLFDLFRQQWGSLRTISLEAYWVAMSPGEMNRLVRSRASLERQSQKGVAVVDQAEWESFFERAEKAGSIVYTSALTLHNGQTSYTVSGNQPRFLVDVDPEFSEVATKVPTRLAHSFHYSQLQTGLTFQCTPMATRGGNFVLLDLHCRIIDLDENETLNEKEMEKKLEKVQSGESDPRSIANLIQNPRYSIQRLSTTVRCPKDEVVFAGGMTMPKSNGNSRIGTGKSEVQTEDPKGPERNQLYLFVRTSVFNVKPDQSDRK